MLAQHTWVAPLLVTFALALVSATVALLVRCRDKGRAFGSSGSCRWAIAVIVAVAAGSAVAGVFLVQIWMPKVDPYYFGLLAPVVSICGRKALGMPPGDPGDRTKVILAVLSLGTLLLLDRLDSQMTGDMIKWIQREPCHAWPIQVLSQRGEELYDGLKLFAGTDAARRAAIQRNYRDLVSNLAKADNPRLGDRARHHAHSNAIYAYQDLLRQAYLWRYDHQPPPGVGAGVGY